MGGFSLISTAGTPVSRDREGNDGLWEVRWMRRGSLAIVTARKRLLPVWFGNKAKIEREREREREKER